MKLILLILGIILWIPLALLRFALMIPAAVLVFFSLLADGAYRTPPMWRPIIGNVEDIPAKAKKNRWTKWVEMSWRNPLTGFDSWLKQPIPEVHPNPDKLVRGPKPSMFKATRFMQHGIFWEYWSLSAMKNGKFWEFRIGWKFVDGNEDFVPTFQLGPKK